MGAGSVAVLRARDSFAAACGETQTYFDWGCKDARGKDTGINGLLWTAFQWLSAGVGIAVIGGIVYGADTANKKNFFMVAPLLFDIINYEVDDRVGKDRDGEADDRVD